MTVCRVILAGATRRWGRWANACGGLWYGITWVGQCRASMASWNCLGVCRLVCFCGRNKWRMGSMSQSMRRTGVWVGHCRASMASWNCLGVCRLVRVSRVFCGRSNPRMGSMSQSMRRTGVWVGHCRASMASWNCLGVCRLVRVSRVFVAGATRGWDR